MALSKEAAMAGKCGESIVDEEAARALCLFVETQQVCFWPPENDKVLFVFVAVLYLSRLGGKERERLLEELQRRHKGAEFKLVVEFSAQLNAGFGLEEEDGGDADEDAGELLQKMWQSFCGLRGARVASRAPAHLSEYSVEERPRKPVRAAPPLYFGFAGRETCKKIGSSSKEECSHESGGAAGLEVPDIFDTVCNLLQSSYLHCLPVDNLGWSRRHALPRYPRFSDTAKKLEGEPRLWQKLPGEEPEPVSVFRIGEAKLLLRGICSSKLLRSLVLQRPPKSTLPHYHTLVRATAHARLWLGRYDLRIFCDHPLTYGELCSRGAAQAEHEAMGVFLMERGPSVVENMLRQMTLNFMWYEEGGEDRKLLHMRPQDFVALPQETVQVDEALYLALRQLSHPTLEWPCNVMPHMVCCYARLLPQETAPKTKFLLRNGVPKHWDTLHDSYTVCRLADSFSVEQLRSRSSKL